MPELPDLQVFSRNLNKNFAGKTLKKIHLAEFKPPNVPLSDFKKALEGNALGEVTRQGKELHFHFGEKQVLAIHLMLKGQLHIFQGEITSTRNVVELVFDDDSALALSDFMKSATATLNPPAPASPDALSSEVNAGFLKKQLHEVKEPIKAFLMDQKKIRGIGNAYADEILWDAGISPFSICSKIPDDKIKQLAKSIKSVLKDAEQQILSSHPDLITGEIRDFLKVHTQKIKNTPTGQVIHFKKFKSRKTYYTNEQELFK